MLLVRKKIPTNNFDVWEQMDNIPNYGDRMYGQAAGQFPNGKPIITGGKNQISDTSVIVVRIFDQSQPAASQWDTSESNLIDSYIYHMLATIDNSNYIMWGGTFSSNTVSLATRFYALATNTWTQGQNYPNQGGNGGIKSAGYCVIGNTVYSFGGSGWAGVNDDAIGTNTVYKMTSPTTATSWTLDGNLSFLSSRTTAVPLADNTILLIAGFQGSSNPMSLSSNTWIYTPGGSTVQVADCPASVGQQFLGAALLPNGNVIVQGNDTFVEYVPSTDTWYTNPLASPSGVTYTNWTYMFVDSGYLIITGGDSASSGSKTYRALIL